MRLAPLALLLALSPSAPSPSRIQLVEPVDGQPVAGTVTFRLSVAAGQPAVERVDLYVDGRLIGVARPPGWSLSWEAPGTLSEAVVLAAAYGGGQLLDQVRIRTGALSLAGSIEVVSVALYPVVRDGRGRYVRDLEANDFVVREDGRQVSIDGYSREAAPVRATLLLDVSESMRPKLAIATEAACRLIDRLGPEDRAEVYAFNQTLRRVSGLTADREALKDAIRGLTAGGRTSLWDALLLALDELPAGPERKVLVAFTDGRDEGSLSSIERVARRAREHDALLYAVGAGRAKADLKARAGLSDLAAETGGEARFVDRFDDLAATFDAVLADLRAQYSLSYSPAPGPPGDREVVVGVRRPGLEVRYRKTYLYRPPVPAGGQ